MKRFLVSFVFVLMCLMPECYAVRPVPLLPHLDITRMFEIEEGIPIYDKEKLNFINSLILQVWNEDFGKFSELFYKHHFKLPRNKKREFEAMTVTEDTVLTVEVFLKYLYHSTTKGCLDIFKCWIDFYKNFRCTARKKK